MDKRYTKALLYETRTRKNGESDEKVFRFRVSTETVDRQGEIVTADGWELDNFKRNPVFLLSHDYQALPIGKVVTVESDKDGLVAEVVFDQDDEIARAVQSKYERGFLSATSVGFRPIDIVLPGKAGDGPPRHTKKELLEISAVAVPSNPDALMVRAFAQARGITPERLLEVLGAGVETGGSAERRMAMMPHSTPTAPEDAAWDAGEEIKAADVDDLRVMCAWVDDDNADIKGAYKLPHHRAGSDHEAVWRGVAAAMAVLLGARGGVAIPDADRRAVYDHLARHYRQFDKEPPEFKTREELAVLGPEEIKGLFWEGEIPAAVKAGRALSRKNEDRLKQARALLDDVLQSLGPGETEEQDDGAETELNADLSAFSALLDRISAQ